MPELGRLRLHLDADTSRKALLRALLDRGHDVTRTPNPWMPLDASDIDQLLGASAQGRAIFTFNIRDFLVLATSYPGHRGIVVAVQSRWPLGRLVTALDQLLVSQGQASLDGRVHWL